MKVAQVEPGAAIVSESRVMLQIAVARAAPPYERVGYAFSAKLSGEPTALCLAHWSRNGESLPITRAA